MAKTGCYGYFGHRFFNSSSAKPNRLAGCWLTNFKPHLDNTSVVFVGHHWCGYPTVHCHYGFAKRAWHSSIAQPWLSRTSCTTDHLDRDHWLSSSTFWWFCFQSSCHYGCHLYGQRSGCRSKTKVSVCDLGWVIYCSNWGFSRKFNWLI